MARVIIFTDKKQLFVKGSLSRLKSSQALSTHILSHLYQAW